MGSQIILNTGLSKGLVETKHIDLVDIVSIVEKGYLQKVEQHWTNSWKGIHEKSIFILDYYMKRDTCKSIFHIG